MKPNILLSGLYAVLGCLLCSFVIAQDMHESLNTDPSEQKTSVTSRGTRVDREYLITQKTLGNTDILSSRELPLYKESGIGSRGSRFEYETETRGEFDKIYGSGESRGTR